jgi:hypothetical protein
MQESNELKTWREKVRDNFLVRMKRVEHYPDYTFSILILTIGVVVHGGIKHKVTQGLNVENISYT